MSEFRIGLSGCAGGLDTVSSSELLELAQEAEALGIDALWLNEEHFQGGNLEMDGRRCLSPIVLAAAILARTRRLRVGFSVLLLPLHHPIRLAEEIATLDVLSNGRVDFGISRGRNARYLNGYGISAEDLDARFQATLQTVLRAWQDGTMDLNGVNHSVEPKPMQRPHPPIFIGTHTDATAAWAAERGYSLICHGITNGDNVERLLRVFRDAGGNAASVPIGRFVYVSESDKSAREELWPAILKLTARLKAFGIPTPGGIPEGA